MKINWRFWIGLAFAALILYAVIKYPVTSADNVHTGLNKAGDGADQIGTFLGGLFK